jgi:hypothetical protein
MKKHTAIWILLFCALTFFFSASKADSKYSNVVLQSVDRTIDLTTQLARHTIKISFLNQGNAPLSNFYLWIEEKMAQKLSFIQVTAESSESTLSVTAEPNLVKAAGLKFVDCLPSSSVTLSMHSFIV